MYNSINHQYRCELQLFPRPNMPDDCVPFNVVVYGRVCSELMTVPNEVITTLAAKYPDYHSSIFNLKELPNV